MNIIDEIKADVAYQARKLRPDDHELRWILVPITRRAELLSDSGVLPYIHFTGDKRGSEVRIGSLPVRFWDGDRIEVVA